jgi:hypothetical protein
MNLFRPLIILLGVLCILESNISAQTNYFRKINSVNLKGDLAAIEKHYAFSIEKEKLRNFLLTNAPGENSGTTISINFPMPDGSLREFSLVESTVMEAGLAERYPEIKTYRGTNADYYMRMTISPYGFSYLCKNIFTGNIVTTEKIPNTVDEYVVFNSSDLNLSKDNNIGMSCGTKNYSKINLDKKTVQSQIAQQRFGGDPVKLRTFRIAIACTGEWGASGFHGQGDKTIALNKIVESVNLLNTVYEIDFSIHLNLVARNDELLFLNAGNDPYINPTNSGQTISQNTSEISKRIGVNSYDIGHVFGMGCIDGIAGLAGGQACTPGKGAGITCWYRSDFTFMVLTVFGHEVGHQFSASHTFSTCGTGAPGSAKFEPECGSTIMSYHQSTGGLQLPTGITHPMHFHSGSIEQVYSHIRSFSSCGTTEDKSNTAPVVTILSPSDRYIPISTPFHLEASATDMEDNDKMTFAWEQYDAGGYGPSLGTVSKTEEGPLFEIQWPSTNPTRVVPNWNSILVNKNVNKAEVLPTVSRRINWKFVARDNHPGNGGVGFGDYQIKAYQDAGPFTVSFPNQTDHILYKNTCNLIKWDVANTDKAPINCSKVKIVLFKNRDVNNPIVLKSNVDNDGSELVDIPDLADDTRARIAVYAEENIFFDVSDVDIKLTSNPPQPTVFFDISPKKAKLCLPNNLEIDAKTCAFGNFNGNVKLFIEKGVPSGSTVSFSKSELSSTDQSKVTINMNNLTSGGNYTITVGAITSTGDTIRENIDIQVIKNEFTDQQLLLPADGATSQIETPVFHWRKSINADLYELILATNPAFGNSIVYHGKNLFEDSLKLPIYLNPNTIYYWKIIPKNACTENGNPTSVYSFQTVNKKCIDLPYTGNPGYIDPIKTKAFEILVNESGSISDINVNNIEIDAFAVRDVWLQLESPKGTKVTLFEYQCAVTSVFDCSFDDDAPIDLSCPPSGKLIFKPKEALSKFNGENINGIWKLLGTGGTKLENAYVKNFTIEYCADVRVVQPAMIINNPLSLNISEQKTIANSLLLTQDADTGPGSLIYTIVDPVYHGSLLLNGTVLSYGSTFTQQDIDELKLSYKHDGSSNKFDVFRFTVSDQTGGFIGNQEFKIFIGPVANQDLINDFELSIKPNPSSTFLEILVDKNLEENSRVNIYNLSGEKISSERFGNAKSKTIDVSRLVDGIYILKLESISKTKQIKFTKIQE